MPRQNNKRKQSMKLKPRRRGEPGTPGTEPKTYKLPLQVILDIRKAASLYGSQGRALQVGSEILVRMARTLQVPQPDPDSIRRMTYKLAPRTIQVIQLLSETTYEDPGQVLAACVKALKLKNLT